MCGLIVIVGLVFVFFTFAINKSEGKCHGDICEEDNPIYLGEDLHNMLINGHHINATGFVFQPSHELTLCETREVDFQPKSTTKDLNLSIVNIPRIFEQHLRIVLCAKTKNISRCKKMKKVMGGKASCKQKYSSVRFLCVKAKKQFIYKPLRVPDGCVCA